MLKRVPRRQYADSAPPAGHHFLHGSLERTLPGPRDSMNQRGSQRQVARAAKYKFGVLNETTRKLTQAFDPILADADNRQPPGRLFYVSVIGHATKRPDPGRHHRGA